jgi:hypothetical protein
VPTHAWSQWAIPALGHDLDQVSVGTLLRILRALIFAYFVPIGSHGQNS